MQSCNRNNDMHDRNKKILIGISADNGSYCSVNQNGEFDGFECQLIKNYLKSENKEGIFIDMPFHQLIPALIHNNIDLVIASISPTYEREQVVLFSKPYLSCPLFILTTDINLSNKVDSMKYLDNTDTLFIVQTSSAYENFIHKTIKYGQIKSIDSLLQVKQEIDDYPNRRVCVVIDAENAKLLVQHNLYARPVQLVEIQNTDIGSYVILANKQDGAAYIESVNHYLDTQYKNHDKATLEKVFFSR